MFSPLIGKWQKSPHYSNRGIRAMQTIIEQFLFFSQLREFLKGLSSSSYTLILMKVSFFIRTSPDLGLIILLLPPYLTQLTSGVLILTKV